MELRGLVWVIRYSGFDVFLLGLSFSVGLSEYRGFKFAFVFGRCFYGGFVVSRVFLAFFCSV